MEMTLEKITRHIAALEAKVEKRFPKPQPPSQKDIEILHEFLRRLLPTMAPEHFPLVEAYLKDPKRGLHTWGPEEGPIPKGLARTLHEMWSSFRKDSARAVALPPAVVEIYLENPDAYGTDACADCGLLLPKGHFYDCPLCGGVTGQEAYKIKHKKPGYEYLTPYRRDGDPRREHLKDGIRRTKRDASHSLKD